MPCIPVIAVAKDGAERALPEVDGLRLIGHVDLSREVGIERGGMPTQQSSRAAEYHIEAGLR